MRILVARNIIHSYLIGNRSLQGVLAAYLLNKIQRDPHLQGFLTESTLTELLSSLDQANDTEFQKVRLAKLVNQSLQVLPPKPTKAGSPLAQQTELEEVICALQYSLDALVTHDPSRYQTAGDLSIWTISQFLDYYRRSKLNRHYLNEAFTADATASVEPVIPVTDATSQSIDAFDLDYSLLSFEETVHEFKSASDWAETDDALQSNRERSHLLHSKNVFSFLALLLVFIGIRHYQMLDLFPSWKPQLALQQFSLIGFNFSLNSANYLSNLGLDYALSSVLTWDLLGTFFPGVGALNAIKDIGGLLLGDDPTAIAHLINHLFQRTQLADALVNVSERISHGALDLSMSQVQNIVESEAVEVGGRLNLFQIDASNLTSQAEALARIISQITLLNQTNTSSSVLNATFALDQFLDFFSIELQEGSNSNDEFTSDNSGPNSRSGGSQTVLEDNLASSTSDESFDPYSIGPFYGPLSGAKGRVVNVIISGTDSADVLEAPLAKSSLYINGAAGNDVIAGGQGNDILEGDRGFNLLTGGAGADKFLTGLGVITITDFDVSEGDQIKILGDANDYSITKTGTQSIVQVNDPTVAQLLNVRVGKTIAIVQGTAAIALTSASKINPTHIGTDADDLIIGTRGSNILLGEAGDDTLIGENARLNANFNRLTGGTGADTFVLGDSEGIFHSAGGITTITDFSSLQGDKIQLAGAASIYTFTQVGSNIEIRMGNRGPYLRQLIGVVNSTESLNLESDVSFVS